MEKMNKPLVPEDLLKLRSHKNWYYASVCINSAEKDKFGLGLRWLKFVVIAPSKEEAMVLAENYAISELKPGEEINISQHWKTKEPEKSIDLYRRNYIRDSESLVRRGKYVISPLSKN